MLAWAANETTAAAAAAADQSSVSINWNLIRVNKAHDDEIQRDSNSYLHDIVENTFSPSSQTNQPNLASP